MDLLEDDVLCGAELGAPGGDVALEGAELVGAIAPGEELGELAEEGLGLEGGVTLELSDNPGPVGLERVGAGAVGAGLLELAGQLAQPLVFAGGADTHARARRRLLLGFAFAAFVSHAYDLKVLLHDALLWRGHDRSGAGRDRQF